MIDLCVGSAFILLLISANIANVSKTHIIFVGSKRHFKPKIYNSDFY